MAAVRIRSILPYLHKLASRCDDRVTDRELLRQFSQARDESAFAEIVRRHGPMLLRACERVLHNPHDAEDVCQAAFLLLAKKAASPRWQDSVAGWLFQTAYRLAVKARTSAQRRRRYEAQARRGCDSRGTVPDPVTDVAIRELQAVLDDELNRLPEKYRLAILLCCLEGKSRDEAARYLGWTLSQVRHRLEQGRERLRARLARRGVLLGTALTSVWLLETAARAGCGSIVPDAVAKAALSIATGNATLAGHLPAWLAELAKGATKTMFARNVTLLAVVGSALGLGVVGVALGLPGEPQPAQDQTPPAKPASADTKAAKPAQEQSSPKKLTPVDAALAQPESILLTGHKGAVRAIAFSPNGKLVATAGADKTFRVWDVNTGQLTVKMDVPGEARAAAFSPDNKLLAVASSGLPGADKPGGVLTITNAGTDKLFWRTTLGWGKVNGGLAFSADGRRVALGFDTGTVAVLDVGTGKILFSIQENLGQGGEPTGAAAFSPDGKMVVYGGRGGPRMIDGQTGQIVRQFGQGDGDVTALAFFPDGGKLAVADGGKAARIVDLTTGKEDKAFEGKKAIRTLALAPDGQCVAIAREGGELQVWHVAKKSDDIRVWNVANAKEERVFVAPETVHALAFHPGCTRLAAAGEKGMAIVWDLTRDEQLLPKDFKLTEKDLASSWDELGSEEGRKAYAALAKLRADPARSVPFLKEHLKPRAERPDEKKIKQLIADLDADEFAAREKASKELEKLGKPAENTIREALAAGPSLEAKKRLERLLALLGADHQLSAEQQRDVRAVRVLEQAGTPEARKLLEALTKESPGWWVTQEATAALERLKQREKK
jgi:RNA polymerase sigma factor (sigma-70 family)